MLQLLTQRLCFPQQKIFGIQRSSLSIREPFQFHRTVYCKELLKKNVEQRQFQSKSDSNQSKREKRPPQPIKGATFMGGVGKIEKEIKFRNKDEKEGKKQEKKEEFHPSEEKKTERLKTISPPNTNRSRKESTTRKRSPSKKLSKFVVPKESTSNLERNKIKGEKAEEEGEEEEWRLGFIDGNFPIEGETNLLETPTPNPTHTREISPRSHEILSNRKEKGLTSERRTGEKIEKIVSNANVCARRKVSQLIKEKRVEVNGVIITDPTLRFDPLQSVIKVDNQLIETEKPRPRLWIYNKPKQVLITNAVDEEKNTLRKVLEAHQLSHLTPIGRLDFNTEGLLLLSNNGNLVNLLAHPSNNFVRRYRVCVHGNVSEEKIRALQEGVYEEGKLVYKNMRCTVELTEGKKSWLEITLTEGKNRQIRKALEAVHLTVLRIVRVQFGPFWLGDRLPDTISEVPLRGSLSKYAKV